MHFKTKDKQCSHNKPLCEFSERTRWLLHVGHKSDREALPVHVFWYRSRDPYSNQDTGWILSIHHISIRPPLVTFCLFHFAVSSAFLPQQQESGAREKFVPLNNNNECSSGPIEKQGEVWAAFALAAGSEFGPSRHVICLSSYLPVSYMGFNILNSKYEHVLTWIHWQAHTHTHTHTHLGTQTLTSHTHTQTCTSVHTVSKQTNTLFLTLSQSPGHSHALKR